MHSSSDVSSMGKILLYVFGVVALHRSMVNWRRGGLVCHGYMCILLYVKLSLV